MKITNKKNLPEEFVSAALNDNYTRGNSDKSVTQLIGSPQQDFLRSKYSSEIEQDVSDMLWAILGKVGHAIFEEKANLSKIIPEQRLFAKKDGWVISGAIDQQLVRQGELKVIKDFKFTTVFTLQSSKLDWERQLNLYAWLVKTVKDIDIDRLQIIAILRDWSKTKSEASETYPDAPVQVVEIPLWTYEEQEQYLRERIKLFQTTEILARMGKELPPCTDEERWMKPSTYAVMKQGGKRAVKVFESKDEAEEFIADKEGYVVEERLGEALKCKSFCQVSQWCKQYQGGN